MKNITLSADEKAIETARRKARAHNTTLNDEFRKWLNEYAQDERDYATQALAVIDEVSKKYRLDRKLTRDEMNERR
jgi:hypothetical protein